MKKKYRRAAYYSIGAVWTIIWSPIMITGYIGAGCSFLFEWLCRKVYPADWLKTKLRVYDDDPD